MAMEKGLYAAPQGLAGIDNEAEPDIEIEIEDPESVEVSADGKTLFKMEDDEEDEEDEEGFNNNLAEYIDDSVLSTIANELIEDFDDDLASRKDWIQTYVDGLELLGMKIEERSEPWEGACGVYHPLLSEALVKFQAETVMETLPAGGPVKTEIIGKETPEKMDAAQRVQDDMNYQITDVMKEYRAEHERMLWGLGLSGNAFKKVYEDPHLGRQVSMFCPAEDVVVPYGVSSLEQSPRVTHVMRKTENEIKRLQVSGFYVDCDLGDPVNALDEVEKRIAEKMGFRATTDDRFKLLEMHVDLDLEGYEDLDEDGEPTGLALPYVVTIEKGTQTVLSIRRNWKEDDEHKIKRNHFVHYGYVPGFGFYCFGLIHLVGAFAKSGTSLIRQLVDAGTLSNLPGGFKTRGLRVKGDDTPISPGEFRDVDVPSGAMKDNIMPLPYKEPSQVLMALLNQIVEDGRRFASAADIKVSDMSANSPVGTTLAILERTLKVMSAVQARVHYSLKQELRLLKEIIAENCPDDYPYEPQLGDRKAKKSDYQNCDVIPVSDPNAATMSQKIVQYQAVLQLAQQAPQLYNMAQLHRQMLSVLGIKNAEKLVALEEDKKPQDPVTENQNLIMSKPVKAFLYQDHKSHIAVHMAAVQDPKIMALMQQNPQAGAIQAALAAHVSEHLAYEYRKQMEQLMGTELPHSEEYEAGQEEIPRDMEVRISQMAAQAAQQLLQQNQGEAQQQQNKKMQEDPLIQLQQKELEIKSGELQLKQQQQKIDAAAKADQLQIERERIASQKEIAGMQVGAKVAKDKAELSSKQEIEGVRIGAEIGRNKEQMAHQANMARDNRQNQQPKKGNE